MKTLDTQQEALVDADLIRIAHDFFSNFRARRRATRRATSSNGITVHGTKDYAPGQIKDIENYIIGVYLQKHALTRGSNL